MDIEDVEVYMWHFKDTEIEAAVLLAIGTGLRRGEIIALDVDDINLHTGRVSVDDAFTQQEPVIYHGTPKSRFGIRNVYLPDAITARLAVLLKGKSGPVVIEDGDRMKPDRLTAIYTHMVKKLPDGVRRIALKNQRHTSLTLAYDSGADILEVSRRGGHCNTKVTTDYYVRPKGSRDKETAKAMNKSLSKTRKKCAKMCQTQNIATTFRTLYEF